MNLRKRVKERLQEAIEHPCNCGVTKQEQYTPCPASCLREHQGQPCGGALEVTVGDIVLEEIDCICHCMDANGVMSPDPDPKDIIPIRENTSRRKLITEGYYCWHVSGHYPNGNAKCSRHVCGAPGYHHHTTTPVNNFNSEPSWDSYFDCSASVGPSPEGGDSTSVDRGFVHEPEEFETSRPSQGRLDRGKMMTEGTSFPVWKRCRAMDGAPSGSEEWDCDEGGKCKNDTDCPDGGAWSGCECKTFYKNPDKKDSPPDGYEESKRRTKEQTTAGAAGAYSQPLFGKPMKRKIAENNVKIKESELISLIEKSIYSAQHGGVIKEALTDADEKRIGVLARKELKDYEIKLEKKIDQLIKKSFKGKDFEDRTLKIARNAIIQLYKALWIRRSFWSDYIKNVPS